MRKTILGIAALAAIATPLVASAANAYTMDDAGNGFVGKGEVQSAFGWKNADAQKNQSGVTFAGKQDATQTLTQSVTQNVVNAGMQMGVQTATQTGTQTVSQDLTCEFTNGNGTKTFHREGERDATREGTREGERTGARYGNRLGTRTAERTGTLSGAMVSDLSAKDKITGQYTGWYLKGFKGAPAFTTSNTTAWSVPTFGEYTFGDYKFADWGYIGGFAFGDYTFGETKWGEWDAAPGENPDDCLRSQNADHITQISNVITEGAVVDGAVTPHETTPGALVGWYNVPNGTSYGDEKVTATDTTGIATVYATFGGTSKALTLAVPAV